MSVTFNIALEWFSFHDFRQISVLPRMAKVIEKIQLQLNITDLKILNNQHAFTSGRSTVSALISTTQNSYNAILITLSLEEKPFIVFRNAFDLMNFNEFQQTVEAMDQKFFNRKNTTS